MKAIQVIIIAAIATRERGNEMGMSVVKTLKRVNKCLQFLYRKGEFFTTKERKLSCQSLCQPHFAYACNVWFLPEYVKKPQIKIAKCSEYVKS